MFHTHHLCTRPSHRALLLLFKLHFCNLYSFHLKSLLLTIISLERILSTLWYTLYTLITLAIPRYYCFSFWEHMKRGVWISDLKRHSDLLGKVILSHKKKSLWNQFLLLISFNLPCSAVHHCSVSSKCLSEFLPIITMFAGVGKLILGRQQWYRFYGWRDWWVDSDDASMIEIMKQVVENSTPMQWCRWY